MTRWEIETRSVIDLAPQPKWRNWQTRRIQNPIEAAEIPQEREIADAPIAEGERAGASAGHSGGNQDAVEAAIATALERASAAGQWTVCEVLARELEARRKARSSVVDLESERARRGK
ncbi:MAG: hypothetical protein HYZ29_23460 [Myxococcales bacterium]|nr:hypothetical protein [Myxococcales bacterium]